MEYKYPALLALLALIVLQVFVPALFDIIMSIGIAVAAGFLGYLVGKGGKIV